MIFEPALNPAKHRENVHYFNQVGILFGAATWNNKQNIAP